MKKGLLGQITKFGLVGVLCFFVDYFTYRLGNYFFEATGIAASFPAYVYVSQALGFTDSVIVNYLLSMKYVSSFSPSSGWWSMKFVSLSGWI